MILINFNRRISLSFFILISDLVNEMMIDLNFKKIEWRLKFNNESDFSKVPKNYLTLKYNQLINFKGKILFQLLGQSFGIFFSEFDYPFLYLYGHFGHIKITFPINFSPSFLSQTLIFFGSSLFQSHFLISFYSHKISKDFFIQLQQKIVLVINQVAPDFQSDLLGKYNLSVSV